MSNKNLTVEGAGSGVGQHGQGNFKLAANFGYIHDGQLTIVKACVSVGS